MRHERIERAETLESLTRPEHLLVWAMRAIALGREDCPVVVKMFHRVCSARGQEVLQAYGVFVKYVAMTSQRRLQVHAPGCPCVGGDEQAVVQVLAAAQRSIAAEDGRSLEERLSALTGRRADESLMMVARAIGALLLSCGLVIPTRPAADPAAARPAEARRLH
jgi:hypothetical protein